MPGASTGDATSYLIPLGRRDGRRSSPAPELSVRPRPYDCPASAPFGDITPHLSDWRVTIHMFPAAWPRTLSLNDGATARILHPPRAARLDREGAEAEVQRIIDLSTSARSKVGGAHRPKPLDEPQLWVAANRYARKEEEAAPDSLTLVLSHANGLHKETWEPTIAALLSSPAGARIREVWALDAVNQGDSALLNLGTLSEILDWRDLARDVLQFVLRYLPKANGVATIEGCDTPALLPEQSVPDTDLLDLDACPLPLRKKIVPQPWRGHRVVLVGHSLGGCSSALASSVVPRLFDGLALVDPVVVPAHVDRTTSMRRLALGALVRRDEWQSWEDAHTAFSHRTFFQRWDSAVLQRYIYFALSPSGDPAVLRLKCRPLQEAVVFADPPRSDTKAYARLTGEPRPLGSSMLVFAAIERSVHEESSISDFAVDMPWFSVSRVAEAGHLIVQESPVELAEHLGVFINGLKAGGSSAKL